MQSIAKAFVKHAEQLSEQILRAAKHCESVVDVLESCEYCAYLKGHQGKLIAANSAYNRVFGGGCSVAGREPDRYLDDATLAIANASDKLIDNGCRFVVFDHLGPQVKPGDLDMLPVECRTIKISLVGRGVPAFACLGLTRVEGRISPGRSFGPNSAWKSYSKLRDRTKTIAILLAQGAGQRDITERLGISSRTLTAEKKQILDTLGVDNTHELARLLTRVQDAGFEDLGL